MLTRIMQILLKTQKLSQPELWPCSLTINWNTNRDGNTTDKKHT